MAARRRPAGARGEVLAGVARVLVDGRNVQHALRRVASDVPDTALVARLRAALPDLDVRLVLDGHPAGGPRGRIAPGFAVEYGRHRDADSVIGDLVADGARELGPAGADAILVVTDDRAVRDQARHHGARVASAGWLVERLARGAGRGASGPGAPRRGTAIGHGRPPRSTDDR
jgi:hypothetical protein